MDRKLKSEQFSLLLTGGEGKIKKQRDQLQILSASHSSKGKGKGETAELTIPSRSHSRVEGGSDTVINNSGSFAL